MTDRQISEDELTKVRVGLRYIQRELFIVSAALTGARQLLSMQGENREVDAILDLCGKSTLFAANFVGERAADIAPPVDAP